MKTSDVLRGAADHIEEVGLHKGWYFGGPSGRNFYGEVAADEEQKKQVEDLPCCTIGGIFYAAASWTDADKAQDALYAELRKRGYESIPDWSDRPSQRKGRVVAKLRRVADELDKQEAA